MTGRTLKRYWPWWVVLGFMVVYELITVTTNIAPTFSEMVWQADAAFPPLSAIVVTIVTVLLWHFFLQRRRK